MWISKKKFPLHRWFMAAGAGGMPARFRSESPRSNLVDGPRDSDYIGVVAASIIQVGQVWKKDDSGESYLITKLYNEALATYALLRKAGAETEKAIKVKVDRSAAVSTLPGFTYTQESDEF